MFIMFFNVCILRGKPNENLKSMNEFGRFYAIFEPGVRTELLSRVITGA